MSGLLTALLVTAEDSDRLVESLKTWDFRRWRLPNEPMDYYTFAGEIPSSPEFASRFAEGAPELLCRQDLREHADFPIADFPIEVEILAHRYSWGNYHSPLNQAGGALVPSHSFSSAFDLRGISQSFDQILPDGTAAAISLRAPAQFDGHLL